MPQELADDWSIMLQLMARCCQATSHYLNHCWQVLWLHTAPLSHSELTWLNDTSDHQQSSYWAYGGFCSPLRKHFNRLYEIDGLVQERRNSSALAMELHLSCTNPLRSRHWICTKCNGMSSFQHNPAGRGLIHCGLVTPYGGRDLGQDWLG